MTTPNDTLNENAAGRAVAAYVLLSAPLGCAMWVWWLWGVLA